MENNTNIQTFIINSLNHWVDLTTDLNLKIYICHVIPLFDGEYWYQSLIDKDGKEYGTVISMLKELPQEYLDKFPNEVEFLQTILKDDVCN